MLLKAAYAALVAIEIVFVPLYLKKMWPKKNWNSLGLKMVCATAYIFIGLLAVVNNGEMNRFAVYMITALGFSWLGDLLLHIPKGKIKLFFLLGMISFMTAHVFFVLSFIKAQTGLLPGTPAFCWQEIAVTAFIAVAFMAVCYMRGIRFEVFFVPGCLYAVAVTLMMVKAVSLAWQLIAAGSAVAHTPVAAALLILGGLCFIQSDGSLALISFDTRFKKFKLKVYNIVTYFGAQVCLASLIFFLD